MRNYDCMLRDAKRIFCHLCDCCFSFKKDKSPISPFGSSVRFVETTPRFHGFTSFFLRDAFILPTSLGAHCRLQYGCGHSRLSRFKRLQTGKVGFRLHVQRQYEHPPNLFVGFSHGVLAPSALVTKHRIFVPPPFTTGGSGRRCWDLWSAR